MKPVTLTSLILAAILSTTSGLALAEKPSWAGGGGKHDKKNEAREEHRENKGAGGYSFDNDSRHQISSYYGGQARAGNCPPGLAKKHNGCQPPGQAKKWMKGRPLPADLRYYDLPRDLLMRLPPPPPRHRYVQIAGDVLMIAVGTNMVIDAIEDIMR